MKQLHSDFFKRDAFEIAPDLIGKLLCVRQEDGELKCLRISETEVYCGLDDSATHARFGRTRHAGVLYEEGGTLYIYRSRGVHYFMNFVTGERDYPQAVMIRACESADGPGKLTKALGITNVWHGLKLDEQSHIYVFDDGQRFEIEQLPRVGIGRATERDRNRLWRYRLKK